MQETIESLIAEKRQKNYVMYDEKLLIRFQACIKGYLLRKRIVDRYAYINDNIRSVIMIQAWWRGVRQRKRYRELLRERKRQLNLLLHHNKFLNAKANNKNEKLQDKSLNVKRNNMNDKLNYYKKQVN